MERNLKESQEYKRAKWLASEMRDEKWKNGISLKEIRKICESKIDFQEFFNVNNHSKKDQWYSSLRRWIRQYSNIERKDKKEETLFLSLSPIAGNGIYTYAGNKLFKNYYDDALIQSLKSIEINPNLKELEKEAIVKIRLNQSKFRKLLLKEFKECPIKSVDYEKLLIASHIVDYKDCQENIDKVNANNGLLLTPDADKLFDRKLITFNHNTGKMIICEKNQIENINKLIKSSSKIPKQFLTKSRKKYLEERNKLYNLL